jgi:radical SAM superfamily enzyme YgiQ (UPF0313 family)
LKPATESGTVRKKWNNRLPVALIYPNTYPVAVSNLGFQIVYSLLNEDDCIVCERIVYPQVNLPLRSLESNRPLRDFPVICISVSFEDDFPRLAAMLAAGGIAPMAGDRDDIISLSSPLVIIGGAAIFMNPEPVAPFADCMVIGEAEPVIPALFAKLKNIKNITGDGVRRKKLLATLAAQVQGCYVPSLYQIQYKKNGQVDKIIPTVDAPPRVKKVVMEEPEIAGHSMQMSPLAELGMYMVELGRGCSRSCRFCAAGFIYRPPRMWSADSIIAAIDKRPDGVNRIGLLGMEMADEESLNRIAVKLRREKCSLSFSSLRADRISSCLLDLLASSGLRSVAIAPDGSSERLRRVINKNLSEEVLIDAAARLVAAGILHLKLYVMIGLPTETEADLDELVVMLVRMRAAILPIARQQKKMANIVLSVNSFVPKPWTPFQYVSFGGLAPEQAGQSRDCRLAILTLKKKIKYLRSRLKSVANIQIKVDRPERVLEQAVFSRGDRRLAGVILDMGTSKYSFKQAMKAHGLSGYEYAVRPRSDSELFCWDIVDHGIKQGYLAGELHRALREKNTSACIPKLCRRCGVCHGKYSCSTSTLYRPE